MTSGEQRVIELADRIGPSPAFAQLTAANDALILCSDLDNGREISHARTEIYTGLVLRWAESQRRAFGYDKPFAVVALGGTGRQEMTPCSDNDFAFLFEEDVEDNAFLKHLQAQILHRGDFTKEHGFACEAMPFCLADIPELDGKQLNSFLDMRPVYDPEGFSALFRDRIRELYDPFDHFLHVREHWTKVWEPASWKCERLDHFDIKNEGLRIFLAGIWTLAGENFQPSWEIYESEACSESDLDAYAFLLRIRSFIQLRHPNQTHRGAPGDHPEDILGFDDFASLGDLLGKDASELDRHDFGNDVRARLLSARRRVGRFGRGVIHTALREGRRVCRGSRITLGLGGLYDCPPANWKPQGDEEKSQVALSLMLASQRYGLPVDPAEVHSTFLGAGEWLSIVPEVGQLFYEERGSLADVFTFLAGTDGAEEKLFPGYAKFEASFDGRVMDEKQSLRGALEREKLSILEDYVAEGKQMLAQAVSEAKLKNVAMNLSVEVEAASLDADHLAAVKLALKTKRLPVIPDDLEARKNTKRPLHERLSTGISGIPLDEYFTPHLEKGGFSAETLELTRFLIRYRNAFRELARVGFNPEEQVEEFVHICGSEAWLRALYVFTQADQAAWTPAELHSAHRPEGFNIRELYVKAMAHHHPPLKMENQLVNAGFTPDQLDLFQDLRGVFNGAYSRHSPRFCYHLVELAEDPNRGPLVKLISDGPSTILGVAARDYRGLAATITGALAQWNIPLIQAHLFSAKRYGLALDFFHVALEDRSQGTTLAKQLQALIQEEPKLEESATSLPPLPKGTFTLRPWDDEGRFQLHVVTKNQSIGLIHALIYRIYHDLEGNIFGLSAYTARDTAYISVYHSLPDHLSWEAAEAIVKREFVAED